MTYDAPPAAADLRARQGGLSDAVGHGRGSAHRRRAAAGHCACAASAARSRSTAGDIPIGTALFRVADNPADLHARLTALATKHGAEIVPIDSTYVESGTSLGSNENAFLKKPRVLLAWDTPTSSLSAGWTRYVLERRFGQPVTAVRTARSAAPTSPTSTSSCCRRATTAASINDAVLNRLEGLDPRWRHARHAGRSDAMGDGQQRRSAGHDAAAEGREAGRCRCAGAGASGASGCGGWGSVVLAGAGGCECVRVRGCAVRTPPSTTTRRFNRIASGRPRSPAPSCTSRSTPITGSPPGTTTRPRR